MKFTKEWVIRAFERAIRTAAQTALAYFTIGMTAKEVDWLNVLSVALVAMVYSLLTSIVFGVPEADKDGTLFIDTSGENEKWLFSLDDTLLNEVSKKKSIRLAIDPTADLSAREKAEATEE